MFYPEQEDLDLIFEVISMYYTSKEEVPDYFLEREGIEKLLSHGAQNWKKTLMCVQSANIICALVLVGASMCF